MTETEKLMQQRILELKKEIKVLREHSFLGCRGCSRLQEDYTKTFHICPLLGSVDPNRDGCTRRA